eukprot:jgi/Chrzof1/12551/UNPLg00502.t1
MSQPSWMHNLYPRTRSTASQRFKPTQAPINLQPPRAGLRPAGALTPVIRGASLLHALSGVIYIYLTDWAAAWYGDAPV